MATATHPSAFARSADLEELAHLAEDRRVLGVRAFAAGRQARGLIEAHDAKCLDRLARERPKGCVPFAFLGWKASRLPPQLYAAYEVELAALVTPFLNSNCCNTAIQSWAVSSSNGGSVHCGRSSPSYFGPAGEAAARGRRRRRWSRWWWRSVGATSHPHSHWVWIHNRTHRSRGHLHPDLRPRPLLSDFCGPPTRRQVSTSLFISEKIACCARAAGAANAQFQKILKLPNKPRVRKLAVWLPECVQNLPRPPDQLAEVLDGRRRGTEAKKVGRTHGRIKRGPSQYPEEAAALAFFRVPRFFKGVCRWRPL